MVDVNNLINIPKIIIDNQYIETLNNIQNEDNFYEYLDDIINNYLHNNDIPSKIILQLNNKEYMYSKYSKKLTEITNNNNMNQLCYDLSNITLNDRMKILFNQNEIYKPIFWNFAVNTELEFKKHFKFKDVKIKNFDKHFDDFNKL